VQTQCKEGQLQFQGFGRRRVVASFDGGPITADGGWLLLREAARVSGLRQHFAQCFTDHRERS
jgi:Transposase DDE domain group 1